MDREGQASGMEARAGQGSIVPEASFPALPRSSFRGVKLLLAGVALAGGISLVFCFIHGLAPTTQAQNKDEAAKPPAQHFVGWSNPEIVIAVTGQMHGYMQPCGCSSPQYGGLARRYNFLQALRDKGWPVVPLDVGELAPSPGPQAMLKYQTSMKALRAMGYGAIGLGKTEFNMPLFQALAHYSLENPTPTPLASNLVKTAKGQEFHEMNVRQFKIIDTHKPRLGIVATTDPRMADPTSKIVSDDDSRFLPPAQALLPVLKEVRANKAELIILLYQGTDGNQDAVKFVSDLNVLRRADRAVPGVSFVLCLSSDPEPPGRPRAVEGTQIVTVGHKGRYVGVIGLFKARTGNSYELKYELVAMGPEYDTPKGQEKANPVNALMEEYTQTVHKDDYLSRFPRGSHPIMAQLKSKGIETKYVGSQICSGCHAQADAKWNATKHGHAFKALVEAKNPSLRQHDGECVVCHTVGFQYDTGYRDKANSAKMNDKLHHVGCESCHGPAGAHANNPQNKALYPIINPFSTKPGRIPAAMAKSPDLAAAWVNRQLSLMDGFCMKCHDLENDVHWSKVDFLTNYHKIEHNFPPRKLPAAPNPVSGEKSPPNPGGLRVDIEVKDDAKK